MTHETAANLAPPFQPFGLVRVLHLEDSRQDAELLRRQ
jgi:hypothetical protein